MKIFINGFWVGFEKVGTAPMNFFIKLLETIFNLEITLGTFDNSDILLESVFSQETFLTRKKWKYSFFYNGESIHTTVNKLLKGNVKRLKLIPHYDIILTGRFNNLKIVNMPLFVLSIYSHNLLEPLQNFPKINKIPKKTICAIISNGDPTLERNIFLDKLEKRGIHIDYAGLYKNNVPRITHDYHSEEFKNIVSEYKFIVTMENTKQETYITEKILHGFTSGIIPIYWGSDNITDYFNEDRFINVKNINGSTINEIADRILEIINDDNKYLEIVNQPIYKTGKLERTLESIAYDCKTQLKLKQ